MSSIVLEARDVRYRYPRGLEAICGISFHIRRGEKIALVGPNGAGKSTLLSMFNGMIRPTSGILFYDNREIRYDTASLRELRQRVGFVLQNPDRQIIAPTVYQDVAFGPVNLGYTEERVKTTVTTALKQVGLEGFERRPPHHLSGGEKKRVAIAGVLAMDPDVLVLDEPTSGLDPSGSEEIMELLDELNQDGKTIIISTHNVELVYPWADKAILMLEGRILQEDAPEVAFSNPEYVRTAHLSLPMLMELDLELRKRGLPLRTGKPRSILDMVHTIEALAENSSPSIRPGTITICSVDQEIGREAPGIASGARTNSIGAMGTRAKQYAEACSIPLDFTYGVIDKCILKALLGEDSLILTTDSMVHRVYRRVEAYGKESGTHIPLHAPGIAEELKVASCRKGGSA
jgi:cobalt/nickel transport system ATP-binding protein